MRNMIAGIYLLLSCTIAHATPSRLAADKIIARSGSIEEDVQDVEGRLGAIPERDREYLIEMTTLFPSDQGFDRYEQEVRQPSEHALMRITSVLQREFSEYTNGREVSHIDQYNLYYRRLITKPCEAIRLTYNWYWEICDSDQFGLNQVRDLALVCTHILLNEERREEFYHRMTGGWKNKLKSLVKCKSRSDS